MNQNTRKRRLIKLLRDELAHRAGAKGPLTKKSIDDLGWPAAEGILNDAYESLVAEVTNKPETDRLRAAAQAKKKNRGRARLRK